jgi:type IV pilus assembly protein PilX
MEQLISRRLPARRAQSGVALIMVLIMLTAMAIAGVALVRVVDSANVISGNFAFRQSTLNMADLGIEAAAADLIAIHAARQTEKMPWPVGCAADCRYFPVRSVGNMLDGKGLPILGNTGAATQAIQWNANANWDANDVPPAPTGYNRGYAIRYVIDRQCNVAPAVQMPR